MTSPAQPIVRRRPPALIWQLPVAAALGTVAVLVVGLERSELAGFLYLAAVSPALVHSDLAERRLPNSLVLPGFAFAGAGLLVAAVRSGEFPIVPVTSGAAAFAFFLVLNIGGGLGMGDVKLGALLALNLGCLGVGAALAGPVLGVVTGGVAGLMALMSPSGRALERIPFGPYLLLGFWAVVAFQLVDQTALGS